MTMASPSVASPAPVPTVAVQKPAEAPPAAPASTRDQRMRTLQLGLFTVGALLMPIGIFAIFLGWYGVAHTKYQYDQLPYVVSGGLLGLALVFLGGFLYFGAWLARIGTEQRESTRQLTDAMHELVALVGRQGGLGGLGGGAAGPATADAAGDELVLAGSGSTIHRRDCALIAHRDDLHPVTGDRAGLGTCRVCRPDLG
jgi:hypothetical protein